MYVHNQKNGKLNSCIKGHSEQVS